VKVEGCIHGPVRYALWVSILLAAVSFCSGCGTILSLRNVDREGELHGLVYGGVRLDYRLAFDEDYLGHVPLLKPVFALDIPLSLAGDTLALPYTAAKRTYAPPDKQSDSTAAQP